jgi:transposase InsO family protein
MDFLYAFDLLELDGADLRCRRLIWSFDRLGAAFTGVLADNGIAISIDGTGAWRDNVFVERLWRSVKYEAVYLRASTASARRASST